MMTTVDKYLTTEMFEFNAKFSIALIIIGLPWRMAV